jgi:hypothetical protein
VRDFLFGGIKCVFNAVEKGIFILKRGKFTCLSGKMKMPGSAEGDATHLLLRR